MKAKKTLVELDNMPQIQLIDTIIGKMEDNKLSETNIKAAKPYIKRLAKHLDISDDAAMMFSAFFNDFSDTCIVISDIARFFDCNKVKILTYWSAIEELEKKKLIRQSKNEKNDVSYSIPGELVKAIRENTTYIPQEYKNLPIDQWVDELHDLMNDKRKDNISFEYFRENLNLLIRNNPHLTIAHELSKFINTNFVNYNLIILCVMINLYIQNDDEHITRSDIEDFFSRPHMARWQASALEEGSHDLQTDGLVEHCNSDGQVESNAWKLTDKAKETFLSEIEKRTPTKNTRDLKSADSITPKQLFFNPSVSKQIQQLDSLLQAERFASVQENLVKHGMRRGFACIFYGAPGTGKTESVLQLARNTGRAIMIVDVPNLRSKWVGDTEKNTKAIFDKYKSYCKQSDLAPILLFNEADAILCKRNEGATTGVDKMENAMQNIILQEMENLEGIMIATTNLTGNLDSAFERRFLYKIEFPKPTPAESKHIWHSMLPDITEQEAYNLAKEYSFSGGQIENIARKQIVNAVLSGDDTITIDAIHEACKCELFNNPTTRRIGF
jgi:hypothetical protein